MTIAGRCLRPHAVLQGLWKSGVRCLHQLHWRKQHKQQQWAIFLSQLPLWSGRCQEKPHSYKRIVGTTFYILFCFNTVSLFFPTVQWFIVPQPCWVRDYIYIYFWDLYNGCNLKQLNDYKGDLRDLTLEYSVESPSFIQCSMKVICRNFTHALDSWYHNDGVFKCISLF